MAWRRNPLYSTRSALRSAVFVLLAIAAMIGVVVAAVNLTIHRSTTEAGITIRTVVVFCTVALVFINQAVSTPKEAKFARALPPSAKLVHIRRQNVYNWAKYLAILLVVCAILATVLPGNTKYVALVFGGMALFLAIILLPVMYVNARNFDHSLTGVMCNPWVHWQYSPEEWKQWADVQGGTHEGKGSENQLAARSARGCPHLRRHRRWSLHFLPRLLAAHKDALRPWPRRRDMRILRVERTARQGRA